MRVTYKKHLFLFRGFLIMKTTFLYFPGMLAKSSASENYLKKQNQEVRLVAIKSAFLSY